MLLWGTDPDIALQTEPADEVLDHTVHLSSATGRLKIPVMGTHDGRDDELVAVQLEPERMSVVMPDDIVAEVQESAFATKTTSTAPACTALSRA